MTVNESQVAALQSVVLPELRMRLGVAEAIVKAAKAKGDERWRQVQDQVDTLQAAIDTKVAGLGGKPEPVVIEMNPAFLKARRAGIS